MLGGLCFSGSGLAGDDDGLGLFENAHITEGLVGDGEDMGRFFSKRAALVAADCGRRVELRDLFVGVDCYEDVGYVCLKERDFLWMLWKV